MTDSLGNRLESWKEIATYLGRGVRTVRRWETEEGLPVHRHMHRALGSVYAYKAEIDVWRERETGGVPRGGRLPIPWATPVPTTPNRSRCCPSRTWARTPRTRTSPTALPPRSSRISPKYGPFA